MTFLHGGGGGHFFLVLRRRNGASRGIGKRGRWKRQVECRYYVELEGAEPERGMKLLPRETAEFSSLFPPSLPGVPPPRFLPLYPFATKGWVGFARSFESFFHKDVARGEYEMMIAASRISHREPKKQIDW